MRPYVTSFNLALSMKLSTNPYQEKINLISKYGNNFFLKKPIEPT
jgi:hypothetical protein